jgi:hypothetical protein
MKLKAFLVCIAITIEGIKSRIRLQDQFKGPKEVQHHDHQNSRPLNKYKRSKSLENRASDWKRNLELTPTPIAPVTPVTPVAPVAPVASVAPVAPSSNTNTPTSTVSNSQSSDKVQSLSEKAYKDYENAILQINFLMGANENNKFDSSLENADLFAKNNTVFGFEWRNGQFIRMPFPTYLEMHNTLNKKVNDTMILVPLKNRFKPRKVSAAQMDCPLHLKIVGQRHYINRFNKLEIELSTPCKTEIIQKVFLNPVGLRQTLNLLIDDKSYSFQFRSAFNETSQYKIVAETFKEVRQVVPVHHQVNYIQKKYLNEFMHNTDLSASSTDSGQKVTPDQLISHEKLVLGDMISYYKKIDEFYKNLDVNKPGSHKFQMVNDNMVNSTDSPVFIKGLKSENQKQQERNEAYWGFGMDHWERHHIQYHINVQLNTMNEIVDMCSKICSAQEFYNSWDFCSIQCMIDRNFLSNVDPSGEFALNLYNNSPWIATNSNYFIISSNISNNPTWKIEEIEKIWQGPPVTSCTQTWSTLKCSLV